MRVPRKLRVLCVLGCCALQGACSREPAIEASPVAAEALSALQLVLTPWPGDQPLDQRLRALQQRVAGSRVPAQALERLGWTFIAHARESSDPGASRFALYAAEAMEQYEPASPAAQALRGHALHSLHHFSEAEQIAQRLVDARGLSFDFGLLGDVLIDRGELPRAIAAYQQMMDIRPDMHSYARAGHVRYLSGDLSGAIGALELAARAASPRNREGFAWTWAKLAQYQLQAEADETASECVARALAVFPDSVPALKLQAQIALARGELEPAALALQHALRLSPHPELYWWLLETRAAQHQPEQVEHVRAQLMASGEREDPRAFALFLGSHGLQLQLAEALLQAELKQRHDIYTYEALAWVQSARGAHTEALANAHRSLAAGTHDPRLLLHAGLVAERAGDLAQARTWIRAADSGTALLLPSQRDLLKRTLRTYLEADDAARADGIQTQARRGNQ